VKLTAKLRKFNFRLDQGQVKKKIYHEPSPGVDVTLIVPPMRCNNSLQIESPTVLNIRISPVDCEVGLRSITTYDRCHRVVLWQIDQSIQGVSVS
jgi:hypothetical protein